MLPVRARSVSAWRRRSFNMLPPLAFAPHRHSTGVFGARMRRVTCVAPSILRANVHDLRFRVLGLGLEGGDERVLGLHHEVVHLTFVLEPDGESHRHYS